MIVTRILWWLCYIVLALIMQQQAPGIDFLAPGFLLALQMKNKKEIFWLFLIFTLIQEGTGSLTFGTGLLWYGGQILFFHLSAHLFVADNLLFVSILSLSIGAYRICLLLLMGAFQNLQLEYTMLLNEALIQAIITPVVWGLAYLFRPQAMRHGH